MAGPSYSDQTAVRALSRRLMAEWDDPAGYAACFAADADHVSPTGRVDRDSAGIMAAQQALLDGWAAGSTMSGRVDRLQFPTPEISLLTVYAEIDYGPDRAGERRRTIDSLTAQKIDAEWVLVGCQRTPLGRWPVPGPLDPAARACAGRLPGEVPTAPGLAADRARDEKQLRALYGRMLGHWLDAPSYAECFTPEADYITGGGKLERGWQENVDGHSIIFSAWARNSRLEGAVDRVHFLTCDVAVLVAHGHIVYLDDRADSTDAGKRTVYLLTAQKLDGSWIFIGYQNTPIRAL